MVQVKIVIPLTIQRTFHKYPNQGTVEVEILNGKHFAKHFYNSIRLKLAVLHFRETFQ